MSEDRLAKRDAAQASQAKNGRPAAKADSPGASGAERRPSKSRLQRVVLGFVMGSVIGLIGLIAVAVFINRGQLPIMRAAEFEAAESRWKQRGPQSYDMDLEGHFDIKGRVHVEVRKGEVTAMTLDGQPAPTRLWDYYSVRGLLGIIGDDLRRNETAAKNPGGPFQSVQQQAEFDPELGFPRHYQRTEPSTGQGGGWRIVQFRRVD